MNTRFSSLAVFAFLIGPLSATEVPPGWETRSVREEVRPEFSFLGEGGPDGTGGLVICCTGGEEQIGCWKKEFPVAGGKWYRFSARRKTTGVAYPVRSAPARLIWMNAGKRMVRGEEDVRWPDYPPDRTTDETGWTEVSAVYQAPEQATQVMVELYLQWAPGGRVEWSLPRLEERDPPEPRLVRLAGVHYTPSGGKTREENLRQFAAPVAKAAEAGADLVCLGEAITYVGTGMSAAEAAEPIPGPSTEFLADLAKTHRVHLVAGLYERVDKTIYNTAVLLGADGRLLGKYRKLCLPREEVEGGMAPGSEYPVFKTGLGTIGLMVCWDVHFPEVARGLGLRGAEIIAMPIWGGNPTLAAARAIENQCFLVTSTYSSGEKQMKTGVLDPRGEWLATAKEQGEIAIAEVDLNKTYYWRFLGDFRNRVWRERPVGGFE